MAKRSSPCCIFGICCPPGEQLAALKDEFLNLGLSEPDADKAAAWTQDTFTEGRFKALIAARDKAARSDS